MPLLKGERPEWRSDWLYEYYEFPGPHSVRKHRGVRTERYKYIHYYAELEFGHSGTIYASQINGLPAGVSFGSPNLGSLANRTRA